MRITGDAKIETKQRISQAARKLFREKGFEATSTRALAIESGIATGTLFNYFPTKEAIAVSLTAEALERAKLYFDRCRLGNESLEELIFSYIIGGLRQLEPDRAYIGGVLHTVWSGFSGTASIEEAARLREQHLEHIGQLMLDCSPPGSTFDFAIQLHLYWTLYLGVLAYWTRDDSPGQEKTLAMLDHVVRMFVRSLSLSTVKSSVAEEPAPLRSRL